MEPIIAAHLTARQTLAAAVQWARTHGWHRTMRGWLSPDGTALVDVDADGGEVGVKLASEAGRWPDGYTWYQLHTVRQGIDLLVTLGLLPEQLSLAYTAGYGAGWKAHATRPVPDAERLSGRLMRYAELVGAVQVAAYCAGADDAGRVREVRQALQAAGFGNPFEELANALAEVRPVPAGSRS